MPTKTRHPATIPAVNRICFEMTIRGYTRLCDLDRGDLADELALVKWVVAPTEEALDLFIDKFKLRQILEELPRKMGAVQSHYRLKDGVDIILRDDGSIHSKVNDPEQWHRLRDQADGAIAAIQHERCDL